jgi:hypothetical protein
MQTAAHVWKEIYNADSCVFVLEHKGKTIPIGNSWKIAGFSAPEDLDYVQVVVPDAIWSNLEVKVLKTAKFSPGAMARVHGFVDGVYSFSSGRLSRGGELFMLTHACSTLPGFSGAPIMVGSTVVGMHRGCIPGEQTNFGLTNFMCDKHLFESDYSGLDDWTMTDQLPPGLQRTKFLRGVEHDMVMTYVGKFYTVKATARAGAAGHWTITDEFENIDNWDDFESSPFLKEISKEKKVDFVEVEEEIEEVLESTSVELSDEEVHAVVAIVGKMIDEHESQRKTLKHESQEVDVPIVANDWADEPCDLPLKEEKPIPAVVKSRNGSSQTLKPVCINCRTNPLVPIPDFLLSLREEMKIKVVKELESSRVKSKSTPVKSVKKKPKVKKTNSAPEKVNENSPAADPVFTVADESTQDFPKAIPAPNKSCSTSQSTNGNKEVKLMPKESVSSMSEDAQIELMAQMLPLMQRLLSKHELKDKVLQSGPILPEMLELNEDLSFSNPRVIVEQPIHVYLMSRRQEKIYNAICHTRRYQGVLKLLTPEGCSRLRKATLTFALSPTRLSTHGAAQAFLSVELPPLIRHLLSNTQQCSVEQC